ncbi:hypothetical protein [uncultured Flavobacterium sp.]|uniref:hypothetical protein n=1 Tax=uncultured Flavobacterium sp. TaxID=165435 RepID=UPI00308154B2
MALQALETIKSWFKTGLKPTQSQFWDTWDSFRHKNEKIPVAEINGIDELLQNKTENEVFENHLTDPNAHAESFDEKLDKGGFIGTAKNIDDRLSAIENPDRVLKFGTIALAGLDVTIAANAFAWVLNKISYLNPDTYSKTIIAAATGMYRNDIVVGNEAGTYEIIKGSEGATGAAAIEPSVPTGTIKLGFISVFGATVIDSGSTPSIEKPTIIDNDRLIINDSDDSFSKKGIKFLNLKNALNKVYKSWFLSIDIITGIAYTFLIDDYKKSKLFTNANPVTLTIPTDAIVAIPIGAKIQYTQQGNGAVTVGGAGVAILTNLSLTSVQGETRILTKIGTDTWTLEGSNTISVKDSNSIEQFKITTDVRFKGVKFNSATKEIAVSPITINTAYVHSVNGNDSTAEFQNADKPYKTIDAVFAQWTGENPNVFVRVVILNSATYQINAAWPLVHFEIYSDFPCVLDFTNNANGYLFSIYNGITNFYYSFNLKRGKIYNNRGTAGVCIGTTDGYCDVQVNEIYWNATTTIFYNTALTLTYLNILSTKAHINNSIGSLIGNINLSTFTILSGATNASFFGNIITVKQLILNSNVTFFSDGEIWNIGNVTGTLFFQYTHGRTFTLNFLNSTISGGFIFAQNQGNITFSGIIKSLGNWGGTILAHSSRIPVINLINLTILSMSGTITLLSDYGTVNIINSYIKLSGLLIAWNDLGLNSNIFIDKSTVYQSTTISPIISINNTNGIVTVGSLDSNATSITNQSTQVVKKIHKTYNKLTMMSQYNNDAEATIGGVSVGENYIETTTGYVKTRLI